MAAALKMARSIAANNAYGVWQTKIGLNTALDAPSLRHAKEIENRTQILSGFTNNPLEAAKAHQEKRAPVWDPTCERVRPSTITFSANFSRLRILFVQRLGVGSHDVGDPEADDHVGDALVLQTLDAVDGEAVHRDHVDLERAGLALLFAKLLEPARAVGRAPRGRRRRASSRRARGRAPQRRVGVAADQDRDRLGGSGQSSSSWGCRRTRRGTRSSRRWSARG